VVCFSKSVPRSRVVVLLWQPQQGDAHPALQPTDFFASRPVHFEHNKGVDRGDLQPEFQAYQPTTYAQRPLRVEQPYMPLAQRPVAQQNVAVQNNWNEEYRLLPPAPPAYAEMPRESRIEMAQPRVRGFANQAPSFEPQPRYGYSAPLQRTAEARRSEYYNRY
jgi:hypothetical protein